MIENKLTILTPTTPEESLGVPDTGVITGTLKKFYKHLGIGNCRHIIGMDDTLSNNTSDEYFKNLQGLKELNNNIEIYKYNHKSLGKVIMDMVSIVKTPYVFILEHDWDIKEDVDTKTILEVFDNYKSVNYIRLNKLPIISPIIDEKGVMREYRFEPENEITTLPLTREWKYSGNPHFERVSFLNTFCRPLIETTDRVGRKSYETPILKKYRELVNNKECDFLGTYVLGLYGKPSIIKSTGKEELRRTNRF